MRINGEPTVLTRSGGYLCYDDNRFKIIDQFEADDLMHFSAASDGARGRATFHYSADLRRLVRPSHPGTSFTALGVIHASFSSAARHEAHS